MYVNLPCSRASVHKKKGIQIQVRNFASPRNSSTQKTFLDAGPSRFQADCKWHRLEKPGDRRQAGARTGKCIIPYERLNPLARIMHFPVLAS